LTSEGYQDRFRGDHLLSKDELADHLRNYIDAFNLNVITSVKIVSTLYDKSIKRWTVKMSTPAANFAVTAKHLVQATGIVSQKPYVPTIPDKHLFRGISIHSSEYRNGQTLVDQGVKVSHTSSSLYEVLTRLSRYSSSVQQTPPSTFSEIAKQPAPKPP
jgi:cation diffusion facilitator CzcD-associated flavoprotein CzcO